MVNSVYSALKPILGVTATKKLKRGHRVTEYIIIMIRSLCVFSTQLPDVSSELQSVQDAIRDINLDQLIEEGQQQFNSISQTIATTVDQNLGGKLAPPTRLLDSMQ